MFWNENDEVLFIIAKLKFSGFLLIFTRLFDSSQAITSKYSKRDSDSLIP